MLKMVEKSSSGKLMDMLDIKIKMSPEKAKELLLKSELPDNAEVEGGLYLAGTKITSLPKGLSVVGDLDLNGTYITSLPEGLSVGRSLDLRNTRITSLPKDMAVSGEMQLNGELYRQQKRYALNHIVREANLPNLVTLTWVDGTQTTYEVDTRAVVAGDHVGGGGLYGGNRAANTFIMVSLHRLNKRGERHLKYSKMCHIKVNYPTVEELKSRFAKMIEQHDHVVLKNG